MAEDFEDSLFGGNAGDFSENREATAGSRDTGTQAGFRRPLAARMRPRDLSEILGHANVNITLNRYVHSSMELKHRNMELFQIAI